MLIRINRSRHRLMKLVVLVLASAWLLPTTIILAQAPAASPSAAASPARPPSVPVTTGDIRGVSGPSPADLAKGDPGGTLTGTVNDIPVSDTKAGLTLADVVNTVGQNRIAINFVWTLVTGYLVMFMQAGFAAVETGLCRAKNANHTFMMNFMVYGWGLFAYWVMGFALQQGGCAPNGNLGGLSPLNSEFTINFLGGKPWGLFGERGFFLSGSGYDVGVMVMFLFQMVFMDTATTIVTGAAAERWKFAAFSISTFALGAITYPLFGNWAWGGGWLSQLGANYGVGHGYCDFAGSGVVHSVGGVTALAVSMIIGPRIGKYTRTGKANPMPGHDMTMVLIGCFILAFGWFGFNPGSTLGASGNGLLAGLVAITAPSGFVNTVGAALIGFSAGMLVCLSVEFIERVARVDDPVGAISVHGACGLWGVICVGLFADGTSNYGGSWNGVSGSVTGLFYGDPGQLVAQLVGCATLVGIIFTLSYVLNWIVDVVVGQRVGKETELQGLDIPEMGALGYPEFQLVSASLEVPAAD